MKNISVKDRAQMKRFGDTIRAWYVNPSGVPFHKDFTSAEKMEEFNEKAKAVGTRMTGFCGI